MTRFPDLKERTVTDAPDNIPSRSLACAIEVVEAYVANNRLPARDVPDLVKFVHAAFLRLADRTSAPVERVARPNAAAIRASVRPNGIVSFIDGGTYKTLKRHLTADGFDPSSYRERYGLPAGYPMVASAYKQRRSDIAKGIGLDLKRDDAARAGSTRERSERRSGVPAPTA
ncbi:putative transcriptional regulator [Methylobacterium brachiatum]|uniref:Transcriptional regulator n=1 Tax=Methylobacterium brachiatum TaxID=269660 RepID=A0AAJ1TYC2_9HYPH|nr:MucR family transcriptional regulator [Methylobacterium brachiatum]MCB4805902.1 MucR family transcriptional regulator [Methylobacterium brachiatum]MDQ0547176.1 putative transcriptional regulator [Methylobacterium brachiatum]